MIIDCPNCNKKFNIDQNLIPIQGRLLQCGSCNHKWFFKLNIVEQKNNEEIKIKEKLDDKVNAETVEESRNEETYTEAETDISNSNKKNEKNKVNYLNILLVIIISFIAIILVLDTFKDQLISIFPNINFLLDNLYQSLVDMKLFVLDLIK
tara:strand:- start:427 stop:879 length:453 start_codon:yes stop_codon:yes gene_type:complete